MRRCCTLADELLQSIPKKIAQLRRAGVDLTPFEEPDVSGIAGTAFSALFTYDITRWLAEHHPKEVEIDWDGYDAALLGPLLRRLHPFANEDLLVEANIPYMDWFRAAKRGSGFGFALAAVTNRQRGTVRAGQNLRPLGAGRWERHSHQRAIARPAQVFLSRCSADPPRRRVAGGRASIVRLIAIEKLSRAEGEKMLDFARETSAMRYRELHGFTYGDPAHVVRADLGRGVEVFVSGVPPEHRLPLRAYHAGMFFKNGVPIGYIECLTLFEHMEVGFNLYYTFREGETAWVYARLLRLFRQMLPVTCFAVDPYQWAITTKKRSSRAHSGFIANSAFVRQMRK